jgi:hypothetical protein
LTSIKDVRNSGYIDNPVAFGWTWLHLAHELSENITGVWLTLSLTVGCKKH